MPLVRTTSAPAARRASYRGRPRPVSSGGRSRNRRSGGDRPGRSGDGVREAVGHGGCAAADAAVVGRDMALVSFQNRVLKDSMLRAAYDESQLIGGVAYVASTVSAPGVITRTGPLQRLIVGEFDGRRSARVEAFMRRRRRAGSMRRSATTSDVRSGRSSYSSSGSPRPRRRCASRLGRSARTQSRVRCCWI